MRSFRDNPFAGALDVVAVLRDEAIRASIAELKRQDDLTAALRASMRNGVSVDDLSAASGLPVAQIRARVKRGSMLGEDLDALTGAR